MIDQQFAHSFAAEWIAAWNAHDLERLLAHYAADFELSSPFIVERMKEPTGKLKGKEAIRPYWRPALAAGSPLRFELLDVFIGVDSSTIFYRRRTGELAAEVIVFDEQHKAIKGIAHYAYGQ